MTTITNTNPISIIIAGRLGSLVSPETRRLLSIGRERGWNSAVLGRAPMPDKPVRVGNWLLVPAHQDSTTMPERALRRIQSIHSAGIRPKGFIVAHEAPMLLPAPESEPESAPVQRGLLRLPAISPVVGSALKAAAIILIVIALGLVVVSAAIAVAVAVFTIAMAMMVPVVMVGTLLIIDPILIAVTEDGYWIEIDRWDV